MWCVCGGSVAHYQMDGGRLTALSKAVVACSPSMKSVQLSAMFQLDGFLESARRKLKFMKAYENYSCGISRVLLYQIGARL